MVELNNQTNTEHSQVWQASTHGPKRALPHMAFVPTGPCVHTSLKVKRAWNPAKKSAWESA